MVSPTRSILIVNPYATEVTLDRVDRIGDVLPGRVDVRLTERRGHATELAREAVAAGAEAIYVFSGDGGFNEVLNGIDVDVPLGFVPGGGTSVLPRALGLPRSPVAAAEQLARGRTRRISLGRVNGRRFGFNAGLGFDAELVRRVDALGRKPDGRRPGDAAFAWTALRTIVDYRGRWDARLELEGYGRAAFVLFANCDPYTYAGARPLRIAPEARFELGIDFVAPVRVRPANVPGFMLRLARGTTSAATAGILYGHDLDHVAVWCDSALPLHVDGEDLGDVQEAVFESERDAVTVLY
jgi:diacylglycerol kinase family enzyme